MFKRIPLIILALNLPFTCLPQFFGTSEHAFVNVALRCAITQNQQQKNAAGFTSADSSGRQFLATAPYVVPNLGAISFGFYYKYGRVAFHHEFNGVFHSAVLLLRSAHSLGFAFSQQLKVGVGFQIQLLSQPSYYGTFLAASARFGCQYTLNKQHHIALTLDDIGNPSAQKIGIEHLQLLRSDLFFAQGLSWNPMYRPSTYLTLIQVLPKAKVQLTYGLFPQQLTVVLSSQYKKKINWLFAQSWQYGLGPSLQFGLFF
jgi:hypothetical protein